MTRKRKRRIKEEEEEGERKGMPLMKVKVNIFALRADARSLSFLVELYTRLVHAQLGSP